MLRAAKWGLGAWLLACAAQAQPAAAQAPPSLALPPPLTASPSANCAPPTLTRMVTRNVSPGLAALAPAAQPRTLWRLGSLFLRSEESPDPLRGVEAVVIIAEPDIWAINLANRTARHSVDPGPVFDVRAPVLPASADLPPVLRALEHGCEAAFVAARAPQPQRVIPWGDDKANVHMVAAGEHAVMIVLEERRKVPLMVVYSRAGKPVFVLRYDDYRTGLPERPALFIPPRNLTITEARRAPPAPKPGEPL